MAHRGPVGALEVWEIYDRNTPGEAEHMDFDLLMRDLRADFYYDEETEEITGANGRGQFALTGENPCSPEEIESGECNLDEPAFP